jgi:hypothetical protein
MNKFPLPSLLQSNFTEYYDKDIPRRDNIVEKIIYPGQPLKVSAKVKNLKKTVKPENVFITSLPNNTYNHRLLGSDGNFTILPKRLHSVCFPKIHLGSIPDNNRINVKITSSITVTLPFVPDDFFRQKQAKSERPNKPMTRNRGIKRLRNDKIINNGYVEYKGWNLYNNKNIDTIPKKNIVSALHECIYSSDAENIILPHPFKNAKTLDECKENFNIVLQFIYHYGREEFSLHKKNEDLDTHKDLWEAIKII